MNHRSAATVKSGDERSWAYGVRRVKGSASSIALRRCVVLFGAYDSDKSSPWFESEIWTPTPQIQLYMELLKNSRDSTEFVHTIGRKRQKLWFSFMPCNFSGCKFSRDSRFSTDADANDNPESDITYRPLCDRCDVEFPVSRRDTKLFRAAGNSTFKNLNSWTAMN